MFCTIWYRVDLVDEEFIIPELLELKSREDLFSFIGCGECIRFQRKDYINLEIIRPKVDSASIVGDDLPSTIHDGYSHIKWSIYHGIFWSRHTDSSDLLRCIWGCHESHQRTHNSDKKWFHDICATRDLIDIELVGACFFYDDILDCEDSFVREGKCIPIIDSDSRYITIGSDDEVEIHCSSIVCQRRARRIERFYYDIKWCICFYIL